MYVLLMITHIFVSMVLILVILMQAGRGGGVSEAFGGSSTQTIFGTSAGRFLMKATAVCAVMFILTSLSLALLSSTRSRSIMESGAAKSMTAGQTPALPVQEAPAEAAEGAEHEGAQ